MSVVAVVRRIYTFSVQISTSHNYNVLVNSIYSIEKKLRHNADTCDRVDIFKYALLKAAMC